MFDIPVRRRLDPILDRIGRGLADRGVRADALTLAGFGVGLAAVPALSPWSPG